MKHVAEALLDIKVVSLSPKDPFTWASGTKPPIYCDNRLLMNYPQEWSIVIEALISLIHGKFPWVDYITGTATAGIPHAALIASRLKLPMGFVRSKAKDHGKAKQIEEEIFPGAKVLVIEDLFSTGRSSIEAVKVYQEAGFDVIGVLSIFTHDLDRCQENLRKTGLDHYFASNLTELLNLSVERRDISTGERQEILTWKGSL